MPPFQNSIEDLKTLAFDLHGLAVCEHEVPEGFVAYHMPGVEEPASLVPRDQELGYLLGVIHAGVLFEARRAGRRRKSQLGSL